MKLDYTNNWDLIDINNIKGRLNIMWLTPDGMGISTRNFSHMTILNMICSKSNNHDFWDISEVKKHNVDDPVQLELPDFKDNNLYLANLMKSFMKKTGYVRVSGPYREYEMGDTYGHASKLLEKRKFVVESYNTLTEQQVKFVQKVIEHYGLEQKGDELLIRDHTGIPNNIETQIFPPKKLNFYFDRVEENIDIVNGIPKEFVKYYIPVFDIDWFREDYNVEPPVYPTDMRQSHLSNGLSVDTINDDETEFKGFYLIEGFGSALNAMGLNPETKKVYDSVFTYIGEKSLKLLQNGVLKLCVCYLQESFITDNIIHSIHYNTKRLNINNFYVIVNDFLVWSRYLHWCKIHNEQPRFQVKVFCHSLVEKSFEVANLLDNKEIYELAKDYKEHKGSAMSFDDFYKSKDTIRKNTILSMNRRMREHRIATLCVLNKYNLVKDNGVSFQFTIDKNYPYNVNGFFTTMEKYNDYRLEYEKLREMKYQYVDYPIAMEAKDGVHHGYGWENKQPYLDSYLNITTETDFINPTGYASEKVWKPFGFFQPVLLVGSHGTLEFIRSFGFKTFDGFIDESYDKEIDNTKRFELIEKEIIKFSKMSKQEVHDWYWSMEDILIHNHKLFIKYGNYKAAEYEKLFGELK